jgi:hypothetical protein
MKYSALLLLLVANAAIGGQAVQKSPTVDLLERQVGEVRTQDVDVESILARALGSARIPGGIVIDPGMSTEVKQLLMPGSTLNDLLGAIVLAAPIYRWEINDGVVNLLPVGREPALLSMKIGEFNVRDAKSIDEALNKLLSRSDVKARAAEINLDNGVKLTVGGSGSIKSDRPFSVYCKNVTLREALNAIVRAQGHGVWAYRETHWMQYNGFEIDLVAP